MGAAMARNLLRAGHDVVLWNRTREKAEALERDGARVADSAAGAVTEADVALTMLSDGKAVEQAASPALDVFPEGAVWVQASTVGLRATERLLGLAAERGIAFVDAPVLGTKEPTEKGELLVLASGPQPCRDRLAPIFDAIGKRTMWLGEAPAGSRLKLVLNTWIVGFVEALAETIAAARALDVDPETFFEAISGGPLDAAYARLKGRMMIAEDFPPSFALALAHKDARLVLEETGITLPAVEDAAEQLARALEAGHGEEDLAAVYLASKP
jgi:3-hydroxyisobutyrate dehydrogenase